MDNTNGSAIDTIRLNQSIFEEQLIILKNNATDFQAPTLNELNRLADLLEKSQSFNQVKCSVKAKHLKWFKKLPRRSFKVFMLCCSA